MRILYYYLARAKVPTWTNLYPPESNHSALHRRTNRQTDRWTQALPSKIDGGYWGRCLVVSEIRNSKGVSEVRRRGHRHQDTQYNKWPNHSILHASCLHCLAVCWASATPTHATWLSLAEPLCVTRTIVICTYVSYQIIAIVWCLKYERAVCDKERSIKHHCLAFQYSQILPTNIHL